MGCYQTRATDKRILQYLVLGLEGAGKSCVLRAYEGRPFDETPDSTTLTTISEFQKDKLTIRAVEVGGSIETRKKWPELYDIFEYDALIFVIDGGNAKSLEESKEELRRIMIANNEEIEHIPVAVFVNKSDLGSKLNLKELQQVVKDSAKGKRDFANVYAISSKTGQNVEQGFGELNSHLNPQFVCCDSRNHKKVKREKSEPNDSSTAPFKSDLNTGRKHKQQSSI